MSVNIIAAQHEVKKGDDHHEVRDGQLIQHLGGYEAYVEAQKAYA